MRRDLMRILCCPVCKGELILTVEKEYADEVITGKLVCKACGEYRIEDGIPNLLPKG